MFCEWVLSSFTSIAAIGTWTNSYYSFIEQQLLINLSYEYEEFLEGEGGGGLYLE